MDPDVDLVWDFFKHIFPEFSVKHAQIYKLLWRLEPLSGEQIEKDTGISKATVYKVLHELILLGLVNKTNFKPVGYYAAEPLKVYNSHAKKLAAKLEYGKEKLESLLKNSSGLSGELYLVKKDGGQQRLILKNTRADAGTEQLIEIKKAVEKQIEERQKLKEWAVYR